MNIEVITDARCIVGEGPIWDSKNKALYSVDIHGKRLRSVDWQSGNITERVLPKQTGFMLLGTKGELLGGSEDGVYELTNGSFKLFSKPFTLKGERFNDGKIGPDGRAYMGTFSRDFSAAFYRMESDGTITELFDGVGNSNGLDWDTKKGVMYYNDTPTKRTDCFDYDEKGNLFNRRTVFEYQYGNPDGMTIDANGNLWVALWGAGEVVCIDPERSKIIEKIKMPVSQPSCTAFAGDDLKTLVVTSAAHGINLRDEALAGSMFAIKTDVKGIEPFRIEVQK